MKTPFAIIGTALACVLLASALLAAPAVADPYPVSGKWGVSASTKKGPIDCGKLRVISFNGEPAHRQRRRRAGLPQSLDHAGRRQPLSSRRCLHQRHDQQRATSITRCVSIDADHLELNMQKGGLLKLRKCK